MKPYLIVNGGPIVMVQGENEFGSFFSQREDIKLEDHKKYSSSVFDQLKEIGFKGMEFLPQMETGYLKEVLCWRFTNGKWR